MTDDALDFDSGWVDVPHAKIYWEASGNPRGVPVLYLHGGPGGSLGRGGYRRWHDGDRLWTIGVDQRGDGKSTPAVQDDLEHLTENTTAALISYIDAVRDHLGMGQWIVTGISWGSTLALAYALAHPHRIWGGAVVAVRTTSRGEADWITEGVGRLFPEAGHGFAADSGILPGEQVVGAYARRLAGADREDAHLAAEAWGRWESWHVSRLFR